MNWDDKWWKAAFYLLQLQFIWVSRFEVVENDKNVLRAHARFLEKKSNTLYFQLPDISELLHPTILKCKKDYTESRKNMNLFYAMHYDGLQFPFN